MSKILYFNPKQIGSATRVRIQSPHGSCYDGATGIVAISHPNTTTIMVRFEQFGGIVLPFDQSELVVID